MTAIIETERLTKSYGPHRGIVDVDLVINEGEVFGFLGPNGAGKWPLLSVSGMARRDVGRQPWCFETLAGTWRVTRRDLGCCSSPAADGPSGTRARRRSGD